jgi:hypothetical protein
MECLVGIDRNERMRSGGVTMRNRFAVLSILAVLSSVWSASSVAQTPPMPPEELPAGAEVLNRGPVNEAFAEPVTLQDEAGLVVPREPPADIEEIPPESRPYGNEYVWIPGYWGWDADRDDFIWIGGCWRMAPPKMYWVPGYWTQVPDGWEWVAGFWTPVGVHEVQYLPAPPPPLDIDAPGPPPDPDQIWVPGCWYWARNQYVRRPGYWLLQRADWVWVPSHYSWSPRGYIFVAGHWDYALSDRGVMFAPVYFPPSVRGRRGFAFTPDIVINIDLITINLFAYPRYSHYYFGDYYDDSYVSMGIYPWFDCDRFHTWYDPVYVHDRWRHSRNDSHWGEHQREEYDRFRQDRNSRPPRTYRDQQTRLAGAPESKPERINLTRPIRSVASDERSTPIRFEQMTPDARQRVARSDSDMERFRQARGRWEAPASSAPAIERPTRQGGRSAPPSRTESTPTLPRETRSPSVSGQNAPPTTTPREVRVTRVERVKVPPSPVVAREPNKSERSQRATPPPAPRSERKTQTKQPRKTK